MTTLLSFGSKLPNTRGIRTAGGLGLVAVSIALVSACGPFSRAATLSALHASLPASATKETIRKQFITTSGIQIYPMYRGLLRLNLGSNKVFSEVRAGLGHTRGALAAERQVCPELHTEQAPGIDANNPKL
jgi:hypothetical protein